MSTTTKLICNNFGGIRRKDAFFSQDKITCSDCQNVELFYTKLNSGVGVRTTSGNSLVSEGYDNKNCNVYTLENDSLLLNRQDGKINVFSKNLILTEEKRNFQFARSVEDDLTVNETSYYAWKQETPEDGYAYSNLITLLGVPTRSFGYITNLNEENYIISVMQDKDISFVINANSESSEANVLSIVKDYLTQKSVLGSYFNENTEYEIVVTHYTSIEVQEPEESTEEATESTEPTTPAEPVEVTVYNYEIKYKKTSDTDYTVIDTFSSYEQGVVIKLANINGSVDLTKSKVDNTVLAYELLDTSLTYYTDKLGEDIINLIPSGERIIDMFESVQDKHTYMFVYTESATEGKLYSMSFETRSLDLLVCGLSVTGKSSGADLKQGWLDMFVFSNGEEIKYIYSDTDTHERLVVEEDENINLLDQENRTVKGLGLVVFDSRLWVFDGRVLWYSQQNECRNFNFNDPAYATSAGYMEFVKNITAIYPYLGSLAVFHKDSSVLVMLDDTTGFAQTDESPGGCASHNSLVFHGTDLYFYDDTKKGVFSFKQVINGDKTLGENIALDIQQELMEINPDELDKIKTLSIVMSDRNEVWFLLPISNDDNYSIILIYDYLRGEWLKRKCQSINSICVVDGTLYSAGKEIYEEYVGNSFNGEFIESFYTCSVFNLGEENTMKITKFPPRLIVDGNMLSHFWCKYVKNYNYYKKPKQKEIKSKIAENILTYDTEETYDNIYVYIPNKINTIVKMPSSTFKALEITFYTSKPLHQFAIKSIEFSELKVKQV